MKNFFSNLFNSSQKKLQQELANEVNDFILDEDSTNIALFIENGYKLSFDEALKITMFAKEEKGYEQPIYSSICHIYDTKVKTEIIGKLKKINTIMASGSSRVSKEDSVTSLFRDFSYFDIYFSFGQHSKEPLFKDNQFCVEALVIIKSIHRHIIKEVGPRYKKESLMDRKAKNNLEEIRNQIESMINYIESNKKKILQENIQQKIEKFNPVLQDFITLKEEMALDIISNIQNFDEASFPSKAAEVIAEIKQLYRSIHKEDFDIKTSLELENLYKKRFPQVLKEYITISPHYRSKLELHNESPDKLLIDSLKEIKEKINETYELIQKNNHKKMKITNQYLKNMGEVQEL